MWKKKLYVKNNLSPFGISRSKIDLFFDCKRCFYLDQRFGIKRPHGTALVINNFVVNNFKTILNKYRQSQSILPESSLIGKKLIPSNHHLLPSWNDQFKGIYYVDKKTNFKIKANLDDVWECSNLRDNYPVIIKSTSRRKDISSESIWPGYWKQLSLYAYLLSKNSLKIGDKGILVYLNTAVKIQNNQKEIDFDILIFERKLDFSWIEPSLDKIFNVLNSDYVPEENSFCKFCRYQKSIQSILDEKS